LNSQHIADCQLPQWCTSAMCHLIIFKIEFVTIPTIRHWKTRMSSKQTPSSVNHILQLYSSAPAS